VRRDEEVWLEVDLLENVHGLIVGPMGSGKSTRPKGASVEFKITDAGVEEA